MKYLTILTVTIFSFCLAAADYNTEQVADKDFLLKQKKLYNLLYYVSQPALVNPTLYDEGNTYDIETNIDSYKDPNVVKDFLYMYKHGMLPRGEVYSVYYPKLRREMEALFHLLYNAKNFEIFFKTAMWARIHMNEMQFTHALYIAIVYHKDTHFLQLPPPYEMFPHEFFNVDVLEKAHHAKLYGELESSISDGHKTYTIPGNYSGWYMLHEYDPEQKLNYFTEDIGLNAYYFYFRQEYPFWLKGDGFEFKKYRGEEYLYGHKQLLMRYNLERLSNDLAKIENFDWYRKFHNGYYPTMTFPNGLPFPQRPHWTKFPYYKYKYIKEIQDMESRITAAIDSGYAMNKTGAKINIYTPNGLNILGNMIEGNMDSINYDFYGSIDSLARKILGYNLEPLTPYRVIPSALEMHTTSVRDPAFYRLYKRIYTYFYLRYKMHEKPYEKNEIVYPDLKIESFVPDKMITYFNPFYTTITNGLIVDNAEEAEKMAIRVRQYRLNHKPYSFHLAINADKATKATIRIFLGPKYDIQRNQMDFANSWKYFYEIDNWMIDLNAGVNKIVRSSKSSFFTIPDTEPSEIFYEKVLQGLNNTASLSYTERVYGFPERLLLPKGKKEGMPFQIFVYVNPVEGDTVRYVSRIFGNSKFDNKSFGFPLDKPTRNFYYDGPNMMLKDVMIYHKDEGEMNVTH